MGYIGYSRSVRSQIAINDFEVPKSLITKTLITNFLEAVDFEKNEVSVLKTVPVSDWKETTNHIAASSWHHTSNYYNKTNHYSLEAVAEALLSKKHDLSKKEKESFNFVYATIKVQVWGGSFKSPKLEGYQEEAGIIVGNWFFFKKNDNVKRFKTTANKVVELKKYESYQKLINANKQYKGTKVTFNKLVKSIKK